MSCSLSTGNSIGTKGAIKFSEALTSNTTLTSLDIFGNMLVASFILTHTDTGIGNEGAVKLLEALKSNFYLSSINLYSIRLVTPFHSNSIQIRTLITICSNKLQSLPTTTG
jgi:hypothetical protein